MVRFNAPYTLSVIYDPFDFAQDMFSIDGL
jgi:hypothetical protein